jgi:dsRNA-specific ribonuclease
MPKRSHFQGGLVLDQYLAALSRFPRLSDKGRSATRAVLVDNRPVADVAREHEVSRERVRRWCVDVFGALVPDGWVSRVVILPADAMETVVAMEEAARRDLEVTSKDQ